MVRIEATLRPEEAAMVMAAIERMAKESQGDRPAEVSAGTPRRRFDRADALVAMAQMVVRGEKPERAPVEVVLTVPRAAIEQRGETIEDVGVFADGTCVSVETARRLACDCAVVELVENEAGNPLSVGRRTRTMSAALKRALARRDGHCRFPGCTNRVYLEGHHIEHWADGGETSLENAFCSARDITRSCTSTGTRSSSSTARCGCAIHADAWCRRRGRGSLRARRTRG